MYLLGFYYTHGSIVNNVPFDPYFPYIFMGEEIVLSSRLGLELGLGLGSSWERRLCSAPGSGSMATIFTPNPNPLTLT